jgi:hypothetical protein
LWKIEDFSKIFMPESGGENAGPSNRYV